MSHPLMINQPKLLYLVRLMLQKSKQIRLKLLLLYHKLMIWLLSKFKSKITKKLKKLVLKLLIRLRQKQKLQRLKRKMSKKPLLKKLRMLLLNNNKKKRKQKTLLLKKLLRLKPLKKSKRIQKSRFRSIFKLRNKPRNKQRRWQKSKKSWKKQELLKNNNMKRSPFKVWKNKKLQKKKLKMNLKKTRQIKMTVQELKDQLLIHQLAPSLMQIPKAMSSIMRSLQGSNNSPKSSIKYSTREKLKQLPQFITKKSIEKLRILNLITSNKKKLIILEKSSKSIILPIHSEEQAQPNH